jgi:selenocysteine-specific elongation factor
MAPLKHVIVGTAGHIDHGKSALVEALTGTHPDRLEEEKRRGITIDLGFAFLDLEGVRLGFVDVPGHEKFVRNMLAGVGGIDLVVLVIAADESIKPQTREHFDICRLLEIPRGLIALTKSDLVDADVLGLVRLEVEEFVRGSFLEGGPIVAVSAKSGQGLDELKKQLLQVARGAPRKGLSRHFRLPIDRAFTMKGFGTVVTGTLVSGCIEPEQEVELFPERKRARVRGLHSGGKSVDRAEAGQRTAVNLAGIELEDAHRGMVLAAPGLFSTTQRLDARITLLETAKTLKNRARVHFHQGTSETITEVFLLDREKLAPGESAFAQLRLREPVLALPGDRFILRQFSPVITIGGGVVLDALALRHRRSDSRTIPFLEVLTRGDREEVLAALAQVDPRGMDLAQIIARTGWLESEVRESARKLAVAGRMRILSDQPFVIATSEALTECIQRLRKEIEKFHAANPLVHGISKEELRGRAAAAVRVELFRSALDELITSKQASIAGDIVQRAGREIALSQEEASAKEQIAREFERAGLCVPPILEVLAKLQVESKRAQRLLQLLLREKVLVKVTEELLFHRSAVAQLKDLLATYKQQRGERLPVVAFKELTGVTRKYAIPLLEYLDRERLTRRVGDERVIL